MSAAARSAATPTVQAKQGQQARAEGARASAKKAGASHALKGLAGSPGRASRASRRGGAAPGAPQPRGAARGAARCFLAERPASCREPAPARARAGAPSPKPGPASRRPRRARPSASSLLGYFAFKASGDSSARSARKKSALLARLQRQKSAKSSGTLRATFFARAALTSNNCFKGAASAKSPAMVKIKSKKCLGLGEIRSAEKRANFFKKTCRT